LSGGVAPRSGVEGKGKDARGGEARVEGPSSYLRSCCCGRIRSSNSGPSWAAFISSSVATPSTSYPPHPHYAAGRGNVADRETRASQSTEAASGTRSSELVVLETRRRVLRAACRIRRSCHRLDA